MKCMGSTLKKTAGILLGVSGSEMRRVHPGGNVRGFSGGSVVKNLPANAGDTGSIPDLRRSYVPQSSSAVCHNYWACARGQELQLRNPCAPTTEPMCSNYWTDVRQLLKSSHPRAHAVKQWKPLQWKACTLQLERLPCLPHLGKSPHSNEDHGILQARILEWVATSSSRASSQLRDGTWVSYVSCIGRPALYH